MKDFKDFFYSDKNPSCDLMTNIVKKLKDIGAIEVGVDDQEDEPDKDGEHEEEPEPEGDNGDGHVGDGTNNGTDPPSKEGSLAPTHEDGVQSSQVDAADKTVLKG